MIVLAEPFPVRILYILMIDAHAVRDYEETMIDEGIGMTSIIPYGTF